jgi:hypothetical protein
MRRSIPAAEASTISSSVYLLAGVRSTAFCARDGWRLSVSTRFELGRCPRTFFSTTLGGLLWEGDVKPEFDSFCYACMRRLMEPEEATQLRDVQTIFGEDNYRRRAGEPITEDSWTNYDRVASRYTQRPEQRRRGETNSMVDLPGEDTMPDGVR